MARLECRHVSILPRDGQYRLSCSSERSHNTKFSGNTMKSVSLPVHKISTNNSRNTLPVSTLNDHAITRARSRTVLYLDHTACLSGGEIALLHLLQAMDRSRYVPLVVLGAEGALVERLSALGVEVVMLALDQNVALTRKDSLKGGGLLRLGAIWQSFRYALRLARLMRSRKVDLVHTNSLKADILGGIAARLARVPVIWHVRDRIAEDYLPPLAARGFRFLCRL